MKINQTLIAVAASYLVFGGLAVIAVRSNFSGEVKLNIGLSGIQLQVTSRDNIKRLNKPVLDKPVIVDYE